MMFTINCCYCVLSLCQCCLLPCGE